MKAEVTINRMLSVSKLNICDAYQRTINSHRVNKIVKNFDPDAFGSLTVGKRSDGSYWVVDGYHRLSAAKKRGIEKISCDVFESEGQSHEAKIFRIKNAERASISAKNLFKARLIEGDEQAKSIKEIAEKFGLKINTSTGGYGWPYLDAAKQLDKSFEKIGANGLSRVFNVIVEAWRGEDRALWGDAIGGLTILFDKHPHIDDERLIVKLTPLPVIQVQKSANAYFELVKADMTTNINSDKKGQAMYLTIKHIYNSGLRKGKLI